MVTTSRYHLRAVIRAGLATTFAAISLFAGVPAHAQPNRQSVPNTPRPNIMAITSALNATGDGDTNSQVLNFAPGKTQATPVMAMPNSAFIVISSDGKQVIETVGTDTKDTDDLAYGLIGQKLTVVPVDTGQNILWTAFSPD